MKRRRRRNHARKVLIAGIAAATLAAVAFSVMAFTGTDPAGPERMEQETASETAEPPIIRIESEPMAEDGPEEPYPFNTMSRDWSSEDIQGFKPYTIPREYAREGGYFPDIMQKFTFIVCKNNGVDYAVAVAVIEAESGYRYDAKGKGGDLGYMQVVTSFHTDRMERLNVSDMLNPFQNVIVGVDYLAELLEKYEGDYGKALTAYQYGPTGAYKYFFSAGVDRNPYAKMVLGKAERIRLELASGE